MEAFTFASLVLFSNAAMPHLLFLHFPRLAPPALFFNSHHLQKAVFALESRFHSHYKCKR
ncbi:hypothetical protein BDN70DRAFT_886580 [Pholiota conissans]|uniref:Uncharacterized protein n=1 Tax=Pholiota conissans TaxID=109636 RepID=A0A9P5YRU3_9AGAR|nr:hypothetical protein BDN70DRAFT_886580 [Pholiota conissans]